VAFTTDEVYYRSQTANIHKNYSLYYELLIKFKDLTIAYEPMKEP